MPAFIIEKHADGQFTVFVSSSPTPMAGAIYILSPERVHPVDVPLSKAMVCALSGVVELPKCVPRFVAEKLRVISNKQHGRGELSRKETVTQ